MGDAHVRRTARGVRWAFFTIALKKFSKSSLLNEIWKIEGLDTTDDNENVSKVIKDGGREDVIAVVLGRGANDEKVNEWLRAGSSVDGYSGFAIGRSIFWNSLKGWHENEKSREEAVSEIANSYLNFISVYQNGS